MYKQLTLSDIQEHKQLSQVWDMVCMAHSGQKRNLVDENGKQLDYTSHLFRVMEITANAFGDPCLVLKNDKLFLFLVVSLTHDIIEDTKINSKIKLVGVLAPIMGEYRATRSAQIVKELSNPKEGFQGATDLERDENKKAWQVSHAQSMSIPAKIVKMADQISNMIDCVDFQMSPKMAAEKGISLWSDDKKKNYLGKALAVCEACKSDTEHVSDVQKRIFATLMNWAEQAYSHAQFKMQNPHLGEVTFFEQLENTLVSQNETMFFVRQHGLQYPMKRQYFSRT